MKDPNLRQDLGFDTINLSENPAESSSPDIAVFEKSVYVVWQDSSIRGQNYVVKFIRSSDGGTTYSAPVELAKESTVPHVAAYKNYVYVVYNSGSSLWLTRSIDNGV